MSENKDFVIANVLPGKLNALVKNIMKQLGVEDPSEAVRLVNSGECIVSRPVRTGTEKDGIIYFSVKSDGTTGEEWIVRLEGKRYRVGDYAKSVLRSKDFKPTNGVTTWVAVIKGELFTDENRITKKIRKFAGSMKLFEPNAEVSCLIREMFTDKDLEAMGLTWIITMHKPIKDSGGYLRLLRAARDGDGSWLLTYYGNSDGQWGRHGGFAFAVSQV